MKKFAATYVYTLCGEVLKNGIVVVDNEGTILDVIDTGGELRELASMEFHAGIIVPGFVHAHTHLQLSHLRGIIQPNSGIIPFLKQVALLKNASEETVVHSARQWDRLMWQNGIVACADFVSSLDTLEVKEKSRIYYHTFAECIGLNEHRDERAFEYACFVAGLYEGSKQRCSVVLHAPYTVSEKLLQLIGSRSEKKGDLLSMHMLESLAEKELFVDGTGEMVRFITEELNLPLPFSSVPGVSPLRYTLSLLPKQTPFMLVHNTVMNQNDFVHLQEVRSVQNTWLVTCPNSNLYIENRLPDYKLWQKSGYPICVGTDSLASNRNLSMLDELYTIQKFADIPLKELFLWACKNGADALQIDEQYGTIEKGKKPGLNLISNVDLKNLTLTANSNVKKLI
jgi:aminodeoxyfutalosine deaminase